MMPIWREVDCYSVLTELCRMSESLCFFLPLLPVSSSVSLDNSLLSLWASHSSSMNEEVEIKYKLHYTHFYVAVNKFIKY